jgi:type IV secretory pathway TraG/TraD family ATPase VirD4
MIYKKQYNAFEGFETFNSHFKMVFKMHLCILVAILMGQLFFLIAMVDFKSQETGLMIAWCKAIILSSMPMDLKMDVPVGGKILTGYAKDIAKIDALKKVAANERMKHLSLFLKSFGLYLCYPIITHFFRRRAKKQSQKIYFRGAKLISPKQLEAEFRRRKERVDLPLGSIKMPVLLENRHTIIIGKPGSGKTQCTRAIVKRWYELGRKGIIYDNKGEYFAEFFNPETDLLFNPLDERSLGWNLFNELESYPDVDAVAASLIPPPIAATDPFWNDAARGVFSGILQYLYQNDMRNNAMLWNMLTTDANVIAQKLKITRGGEAGYRYITQNAENSRQAESVLAVMMQFTKCFEYMAANEGRFQINDWLYNGSGMIYITNYEDIEETLRPILSLFVDLAGRKILSMPDDLNRRIFIGLDEFGSLQRLSTIVKLLTRGRSKGACVFIGIQDDGQTEKIYTPQIRKSIDNACGSRITFALTGETAEKEARYNIGETEIMEMQRSMSMGPHDMRDGISLGENKKKELMMLPSEISNLPDLRALVRLKNYDFVISDWSWEPAKQIHEPFVLRKDLLLENIMQSQTLIKQKIRNRVDDLELRIEPVS